ncbi:hypothetical protein D3C85_1246710 [compost metagenome]
MPIAQQIVPGDGVHHFAVKSRKAAATAFDPTMAVGRKGLPNRSALMSELQDRTLLIGRQQAALKVIAFASLLRQQLFTTLEHALAGLTIQFGRQMLVAVKPLRFFLAGRLTSDKLVQGVIAIAAQRCFLRTHQANLVFIRSACTRKYAKTPSRTASPERKPVSPVCRGCGRRLFSFAP